MVRTIHNLSATEIEHILADAPKCCYSEIADDLNISVNTVRKVVRQHNHARLRNYK